MSFQTAAPGDLQKSSETHQCHSLQETSTQFFHFLRLMQLFPDVHPATLHTVLNLCKHDFFAAIDKLLYAKKCKQVFTSRQKDTQKCSSTGTNANTNQNRFVPYSKGEGSPKNENNTAPQPVASHKSYGNVKIIANGDGKEEKPKPIALIRLCNSKHGVQILGGSNGEYLPSDSKSLLRNL